MKAKALNKTQFVALGFVIPRITLESCEETAKVEFHNVGKMNRSTSKVFNQGNLLKGIDNKTNLEGRDLEGSLLIIFMSKQNGPKLQCICTI
jgi:hypothetical protein